MVVWIQQGGDGWQRYLTIGNNSHTALHILVNLTAVDVKMDNLSLFGVGLGIARHTVGKAHTNGNEHVALLFLQVDGIVAMHPQHTGIQRMVGRQCRESQHGTPGGNVGFFQKSFQLLLGMTEFYALPYQR